MQESYLSLSVAITIIASFQVLIAMRNEDQLLDLIYLNTHSSKKAIKNNIWENFVLISNYKKKI